MYETDSIMRRKRYETPRAKVRRIAPDIILASSATGEIDDMTWGNESTATIEDMTWGDETATTTNEIISIN